MHVAVFFPSLVVTVITAVPAFNPFTLPLLSTDATLALLLAHVTLLFVALLGAIVAVSFSLDPTFIVVLVLFKVTPVTAIFELLFGNQLTYNFTTPPFTDVRFLTEALLLNVGDIENFKFLI